MNKTDYINQFDEKVQNDIKKELEKLGLDKEDIENAMGSRLVDLEDIIDIHTYL